jgi:hypothetical protein
MDRRERYKRHKRGDHSVCRPERGCPTPPSTPSTRADHLRDALAAGGPSAAGRDLLIDELARVAARLDVLDEALRAEPTSTALLRAAAQQQGVAAKLLYRLDRTTPMAPVTPIENPLEALRRRRAERMAGSTSATP